LESSSEGNVCICEGKSKRRMETILKKYNFYSSWNNIRTIKPERMKWVGHTERMDIWKCIHDTLWKTSGKRSREIDADGKIILKLISTKR
jgi:hypothetical protein